MKRPRTAEGIKARRAIKKTRGIGDGVCSGGLIYAKLLVAWALLIVADFLLGFRFEYLWPFWLLVRSIYDSFRYQGIAFSVFFVCITVTSDLVCFLFIPVQWLFFLASTYVWVQYVWHADRGICLPTVALWLLFIYVEASVRLKEITAQSKSLSFTLDLCRPFAAHCIGYPVVTMGFGVKSYVGYKLRARSQRDVARRNEVYSQLLAEALPAVWRPLALSAANAASPLPQDLHSGYLSNGVTTGGEDLISNGGSGGGDNSYGGGGATSFLTHSASASASLKSHAGRGGIANWQNGGGYDKELRHQKHGKHHQHPQPPSVDDDDVDAGASSWLAACRRLLFGATPSSGRSGALAWGAAAAGATAASGRGLQPQQTNGGGMWCGGGESDDEDDRDSSRGSVDVGLADRHPSISSSSVTGGGGGGKRHQHQQTLLLGGGGVTAGGDVTGRGASKSRRRPPPPPTSSVVTGGGSMNAKEYHQSQPTGQQPSVYDAASETNDDGRPTTKYERDYDRELTLTLESEVERLKAELRAGKVLEHELRQQIGHLTNSDAAAKGELKHLRNKNELLENKLHNLTKSREQDKQAIQTLEKKLVEEQRQRNQSQDQVKKSVSPLNADSMELTLERKQRKADDASAARALAAATSKTSECGDACKARRREVDTDVKSLKRELRSREEQLASLEAELQSLRQYREAHNAEVLMSALSTMKEKNLHLEQSLSAENRLKQDLFMALGDAKKQIETIQGQLEKRNLDFERLQSRLQHGGGNDGCGGGMGGSGGMGPALTPPPPAPGGNAPPSPPVSTSGMCHQQGEPSMEMLTSAMYNAAAYLSNPYGVIGGVGNNNTDGGGSAQQTYDAQTSNAGTRMTYTPPRGTN